MHHFAFFRPTSNPVAQLRNAAIIFLSLLGVPNLPAAVIPVTEAKVLNGLTLNNWAIHSGAANSTVNGASIALSFKSTRNVALQVDNRHLVPLPPTRCPIIAWSVNGGPIQSHQLSGAETSVPLATGVINPVVVIDLYIKGMSPFEDRYTGDVPPNSVRITGFEVDSDGAVAARTNAPVWLNIGDSILSGDAAAYASGQGRPPDDGWAASDDGRASYGYLLAHHYGYCEARLAYGGYDWGGGMAHVPSLSTLIDQKTSTISRLVNGILSPIPEVVLINLGENGAPALADATNALVRLRSRVLPTTKILVMIPVSGRARPQITAAFTSYTNSTADAQAHLVDLGKITFATADGQHPSGAGHQSIYQTALPMLDPIMGRVTK